MKPKNFPGRKHARRMRVQNKAFVRPPEVADITFRIGAKMRNPDGSART